MNQRGLMTIADKLAGKDLIVEEAGDLQENELEALQKLISRDETGMIIVLVDNPYRWSSCISRIRGWPLSLSALEVKI